MAEAEKPSVWVQFFKKAEQNEAESLKEGRPVFTEQEMVRIKWPGDSKRELVAAANERSDRYDILPDLSKVWLTWAEAFPKHYENFKHGDEQIGDGTPLKACELITEARRAELKAQNIHTLEQLAQLDGVALQKIGMRGRELKEAATNYLKRAEGMGVEAALRSELDEMRAEMAELRAAKQEAVAHEAPSETSEGQSEVREFFESMEEDDIRNWLKDAGVSFQPNCKRSTLINKAVEADEAARKAKAA